MRNTIQENILRGMYSVMRSICRLLLRHEIGFREFSDLAKIAFVQVATEDYGIRGRPTNISRVAIMTGLTRKEVKRIRGLDAEFSTELLSRRSPLSELLHYWHTDKNYSDAHGRPKALKFEGEGESFRTLAKRCAGDIPVGAMRSELTRIDAISQTNDGWLVVNTREVIPKNVDERLLDGIEYGLMTLAATVEYNGDPNNKSPRAQKFIHSSKVSCEDLARLEKLLREKIELFSTETDDLLSTAELAADDLGESKSSPMIGIGIYYYLEDF